MPNFYLSWRTLVQFWKILAWISVTYLVVLSVNVIDNFLTLLCVGVMTRSLQAPAWYFIGTQYNHCMSGSFEIVPTSDVKFSVFKGSIKPQNIENGTLDWFQFKHGWNRTSLRFGKNSLGLYLFGHLVLAYLQLVPNVLINMGVVTSRCPSFKMNVGTDV